MSWNDIKSKLNKQLWNDVAAVCKFMVDVFGAGAALTGCLAGLGIINPRNIWADPSKPPRA